MGEKPGGGVCLARSLASEMKDSRDGALVSVKGSEVLAVSPPRPKQSLRVWGTLCREHSPGAALSSDPSFLQAPPLQLKLITN